MKAIEFKDVSFKYTKNNDVINGLSFVINQGEHVCLLGHNGSGKSTLARLAVGLLECDKGTIYINELRMDEENINKIREDIGIVFQNPDNQFIGVTVKDDIAFGLENRCISAPEMEKKIDYYSHLVRMNDFLNSNPEDLSGGQKQRVAIASVLAFNPNIIIFDESTSMLDPKGVKEVEDTIKSLDEKKTIISITHNLNEAIYANRVIVLDKGKIVLDGKPEDVFKEKEILKKANLDIPESMKLLELVEDGTMNDFDKKRIKDLLWKITFQK